MVKQLFLISFTFLSIQNVFAQPWQQIYPDFPSEDIMSVIHWNGDTLFAAGTDFLFMRSVDRGKTWKSVFQKQLPINFSRAGRDNRFIYLLPVVTQYSSSYFNDSARYPLLRYDPVANDSTTIFIPIHYPNPSYVQWIDLSVSDQGIAVLEETNRVAIMISTNHGDSWKEIPAPPDTLLARNGYATIYYRNENRCALIAATKSSPNQYYLFLTSNGGTSWDKIQSVRYPSNTSERVKMPAKWITDSIAVFVNGGTQSVITTDGGATWENFNNTGLNVRFIEMDRFGNGFAIGGGTMFTAFDIARTTNFGETWTMMKAKINCSGGLIPTGALVDEKTFFAGASRGYLIYTSDAGLTWESCGENTMYNIDNLHFFTELDGVCQASDIYDSRRYYYRTSDGGRSWKYRNDLLNLAGSVIKNVSPNVSYAIRFNSDSAVYRTTDQGNSWQACFVKTASDSLRLIVMQDNLGRWNGGEEYFFVLTDAGLLRTTNRGDQWSLLPQIHSVLPKATVLKMGFSQSGVGWILSQKTLLQTRNSGETWAISLSLPDSLPQYQDMYIVSRDTVYVKAIRSSQIFYMFKTTDGGKNWVSYQSDYFSHRETIFDDGSGFGYSYYLSNISSNVEVMCTSKNEWRNSNPRISKSTRSKSNIFTNHFFIDKQNGWLAGYNFILRTTNGGINWIEQPTKATSFSLSQNYPNPTSSLTTIPFEITSDVASRNFNHGIKLVVYDLLGREVATIARDQLEIGKNQISFDASRLQAGVYCYRLMVGEQAVTRKMVVVR